MKYRKDGLSSHKAYIYCKDFSEHSLGRLKEVIPKNPKYDIYDYIKYIISNSKADEIFDIQNTQIYYTDYLEAAKELNYDLSVHNALFPKNLKEAHDNAIRNRYISTSIEDMGSYNSRYKELIKMYEYEKDGFSIIVPKSIGEIVLEGKLLSHCVGGYAHRHMTSATTILFLRKTEEIYSALYTIEIDDKTKTIRQIQGFRNRTPLTEEAEAFFNEWKEEIKHRKIKKKKIKKSA